VTDFDQIVKQRYRKTGALGRAKNGAFDALTALGERMWGGARAVPLQGLEPLTTPTFAPALVMAAM
jgi:hypothetical protein